MNVSEAIIAIHGDVSTRFSTAVATRWKASAEETAARRELANRLTRPTRVLRRYIARKLNCGSYFGPVSVKWTQKQLHSVNYANRPETYALYIHFELHTRTGANIHVEKYIDSLADLDRLLRKTVAAARAATETQ